MFNVDLINVMYDLIQEKKRIKNLLFFNSSTKEEIELELPMSQIVQTAIIPGFEHIDTDVLNNMTSLGCFKEQDKLVESLLNEKHNTEKVIYFLLLERKLKNPSGDDNDDILISRSRASN